MRAPSTLHFPTALYCTLLLSLYLYLIRCHLTRVPGPRSAGDLSRQPTPLV